MAKSWPSTHQETVGGWLVRANGGTTRRANSALATATDDLSSTLDAVEAFYAERQARTLILASEATAPDHLTEELERRSYVATALTNVMSADATAALTAGGPPPEHMVRTTEALTDEWFDLFWSTRDQATVSADAYRFTLTAPPQAVFATAHVKRVAVAVGQAVVWDDAAVIQCMVTRSDFRRQGLAAALMHGLASACVSRGVRRLELGVLADNPNAIALYERAGFATNYRYQYFAKTN